MSRQHDRPHLSRSAIESVAGSHATLAVETTERLLHGSCDPPAATSGVTPNLPLLAERSTADRLRALART